MFRDVFEKAYQLPEYKGPVQQFALRQAFNMLQQAGIEPGESLGVNAPTLQRVGTMAYRLREERQESLDEVIQRAGCSKIALSRIERLVEYPRIKTILGIAKAFEVSASYLFGETDTLPNPNITTKIVGEQLSKLIAQQTYREVGQLTGLSPMTIGRVEKGGNCSEDTFVRFISVYKQPPSYFFNEPKIQATS